MILAHVDPVSNTRTATAKRYMETKADDILETLALSREKAAGVSQLKNDLKYGDSDLRWKTDCFLVSWLQQELAAAGQFDNMVLLALGSDIQARMPFLKDMLSHQGEYGRFLENASPYMFLVGDDICFGVLEDFSRKFGAALQRAGYQVIFQNRNEIPQVYGQRFQGNSYRGIFGMQDPLMATKIENGSYLFDHINSKKYYWSFDHPAGFFDTLHAAPEDVIVLTLDKNYVSYTKRFLKRRALFFPPGGEKQSKTWKNFDEFKASKLRENQMGISFLGTPGVGLQENIDYTREHNRKLYPLVSTYSYNLLNHTDEPSEMAFERTLEDPEVGIKNQISDDDFAELFGEWASLEKNASKTVRKQVVKEIVSAGADLNVYDRGWKDIGDFPNLIVHDSIPYEDARKVYDKSWMSLNVMSWHKDGFTERIAEPQLHGSLVVTDSTRYLRENYTDGEDIVMFDLNDQSIKELPERIRALLSDKDRLLHIAYNGYLNALKNHTWDARAEQFLKLTAALD
ncbi:MAG: glycosyltransferase family 1 protein [Lachnospiraceae bacterium]|nr:MAG: glycosyltransferase family 1 protein [Lachnospiraceae bacterium]